MRPAPKPSFYNYFEKQRRAFARQSLKMYRNPSKKNVHSLRVTVRRLRSALWLASHGSPTLSFEKLPSSLRHLGRVLGKQRELDVAIQDSAKYHLPTQKLAAQRSTVRQNLHHQIDLNHRRKVLRQLLNASLRIKSHPELNLEISLKKLCEKIEPWIKKSKIRNKELHQLRVTAKKARYALEAMDRPFSPLRDLQNVIGRGHDLEVLQTLGKKNQRTQSEIDFLYQKARRLIKPSLRFALQQLDGI